MHTHVSMTPVMYTDYSGMFGERWDRFKERVSDWWNPVTNPTFTVPSFDQLTSSVISTMGGMILSPLISITGKNLKTGYAVFDLTLAKILPKTNKVLSEVGFWVAGVPLMLDIANTWTAQNSSTIGQRFTKTSIQIESFAIVLAGSYYGASFIATGVGMSATGIGAIAGVPLVIVGAGMIFGSIIYADHFRDEMYDKHGIQ